MQLYDDVCDSVGCSDVGCGQNASDVAQVVLLMPRKFEILDYGQMEKLVELINIARLRADDNIGALTFGAEIPEYKDSGRRLAYPTAPTWQVSCPASAVPWGREPVGRAYASSQQRLASATGRVWCSCTRARSSPG